MPLQKTCNKCKQGKPVADFYANKRMKDGINTFCIECHKKDCVKRKSKKRMDEAFKQLEREYKKKYRIKNCAKQIAYMQQWRKNNREHMRDYGKKYRIENKALVNFLCQKRKIALANRTPAWLTEDDLWLMKEAYALAEERSILFGFTWHVDHIIPLRGKKVSGLHVPLNLQVIPAVANMQKNNRYEV